MHLRLRLPLAPDGIFRTVQGEGTLLGLPMVFVRLAGCSVGCSQCDTDYRVAEKLTPHEIACRVVPLLTGPSWIWVTGGEPADHDLEGLLGELGRYGMVALATSGVKSLGSAGRLVDFLSVSPHGQPCQMVIRQGSQLNLVPGLNGLRLADWGQDRFSADRPLWQHLYVTPCDGKPETLKECLEFIDNQPEVAWRLGVQAHKVWRLP